MENKISLEIGMYKKGVKANFKSTGGITLITLAISRKCVRYEERA